MTGDSYLQALVITRCREFGIEKSAEFFTVSPGLVRQWMKGSKTPSLAAVERVFAPPSSGFANAEWEGKDVFVAAPFYRSNHPATLFSLLAMWDRPKMGFRTRYGDAFIIHAREVLAQDFLASGMPYCFTLDDDMILPCGHAGWYNEITGFNLPDKFAGLHTISQLRSRGKSLIGGLYFGRNRHGRALYHEATQLTEAGRLEDERAHTAPFDEVKATEWTATGCMLFKREVLTDIMATHPHLAPQFPGEPFHFFSNSADAVMRHFGEMQAKAAAAVNFIQESRASDAGVLLQELVAQMKGAEEEVIKHNRLQQGEDQLFCRRAKVAGHQPYVDFSIVCGHVGQNVWGPGNTKAVWGGRP